MGRGDVETGVGGTFYYTPPRTPIPPPPREPYLSWLVPLIFIVDVGLFIYTMYENNCPKNLVDPDHKCILHEYLGRFSFEPFSINPLIGPTTTTLQRMGGLRLELIERNSEWWRLFTCLWIHAGAIHLIANMISLLFMGVRLEEEFGFWRIGPLYVLSGLGGSLMSSVHALRKDKLGVVSVGASGALFGLLGAMLSELITNWTIYANKCSAILSLLVVIALNLAVGLIPGVDSSAHIGGFITGFLLGFVLLMRPQFGYVSSKYLPPGYKKKSRHKCYQYFFLLLALVALFIWYGLGFQELFEPMARHNKNAISTIDIPT